MDETLAEEEHEKQFNEMQLKRAKMHLYGHKMQIALLELVGPDIVNTLYDDLPSAPIIAYLCDLIPEALLKNDDSGWDLVKRCYTKKGMEELWKEKTTDAVYEHAEETVYITATFLLMCIESHKRMDETAKDVWKKQCILIYDDAMGALHTIRDEK